VDITEHRRAQQSLHESRDRLASLSRQMIGVQEAERRHLARELHDEIGQVLCAISVNLKIVKTKVDASAWPRLEESIQIIDGAVDQVRNLSLDLRPPVLDDFGLEAALRWYVDRLSTRTGLCVHITRDPHAAEIPFDVRNTCFRVAQEALTNVVRHASAREVWIGLEQRPSEIVLTIRDDGIGFDVEASRWRASKGHHMGLLGMHERVELLDGKIHLQSEPGKGTTVQIQLPLSAAATPATQESA
jgi:signal transduction histidine kinase